MEVNVVALLELKFSCFLIPSILVSWDVLDGDLRRKDWAEFSNKATSVLFLIKLLRNVVSSRLNCVSDDQIRCYWSSMARIKHMS